MCPSQLIQEEDVIIYQSLAWAGFTVRGKKGLQKKDAFS